MLHIPYIGIFLSHQTPAIIDTKKSAKIMQDIIPVNTAAQYIIKRKNTTKTYLAFGIRLFIKNHNCFLPYFSRCALMFNSSEIEIFKYEQRGAY